LPTVRRAVRVTAVAASAQLGGTERVLLDFAARAFEHDIVLRVLTPRDGPLIGILNEIGVPAAAIPASQRMLAGSQRAGKLWSLPGSFAGLVAWARTLGRHESFRDADVVYSVAFKTHLAAAWLRRHPVVWHLHEYPPAITGPAWRLLSRTVPDAMIANSEATARAWRRRATYNGQGATAGGDRGTLHVGRCTVVPNGVDLDRFRPRPRSFWIHDRLGIPHQHRIIGMPAVFARWKGQLEVIRAFLGLGQQFPDVNLVFIGGSIYDTVAEREYGVQLQHAVNGVNVHLLPFKAKIELAYPEFDLTLHYSLRPEPFGRVVLESMASGVPVIAAGEGGPVEILGKGEGGTGNGWGRGRGSGWLAPPRDVPALAQTLRQALSLPAAQLRAIGDAARRRAEDHFSARQFARQVADVLREAALR
jgi:glycosyltransferase involved in cell wall biosynthesis